jgi:hypothetical protein
MEALTRLVADSLARHGLNRPVDPRRLQWSRWSRCDSPHSLLVVPSKPGIFALAEEIMDLGPSNVPVGTAALGCPAEQSSAAASSVSTPAASTDREGHDFGLDPALSKRSALKGAATAANTSAALPAGGIKSQGPLGNGILGGAALQRCDPPPRTNAALAAEGTLTRRMLAVLQFSEDDDMAYVLDRMFTRINPMRARLASGRCFLRFVVIEDQDQRRSICTALNQWLVSSAEKASGLPSDFSSSLEMTESLGRTLPSTTAHVGTAAPSTSSGQALGCPSERSSALGQAMSPKANAITHLDSGAARNLHCPQPLPSGF